MSQLSGWLNGVAVMVAVLLLCGMLVGVIAAGGAFTGRGIESIAYPVLSMPILAGCAVFLRELLTRDDNLGADGAVEPLRIIVWGIYGGAMALPYGALVNFVQQCGNTESLDAVGFLLIGGVIVMSPMWVAFLVYERWLRGSACRPTRRGVRMLLGPALTGALVIAAGCGAFGILLSLAR